MISFYGENKIYSFKAEKIKMIPRNTYGNNANGINVNPSF